MASLLGGISTVMTGGLNHVITPDIHMGRTGKAEEKQQRLQNDKDSFVQGSSQQQAVAAANFALAGAIVVNMAQAMQTARDLATVSNALGGMAVQNNGPLTPDQMELMMAVIMVAMGKMDTEDAKSLIEAAESRNQKEAADFKKLHEMCQVMDLVNTARNGGCGAQMRLTHKLEAMGYSHGQAKALARMMRHMPPHMQFMFAMSLVKSSPKAVAAQQAAAQNQPQKADEKNPFDSEMIKRLLEAQKEGAGQMMDLMLLLVAGACAKNIQNGTAAILGQQMAQNGAGAGMGPSLQ